MSASGSPRWSYGLSPAIEGGYWWCDAHKRTAAYMAHSPNWTKHCCNPKLGGVLLPCDCSFVYHGEKNPDEARRRAEAVISTPVLFGQNLSAVREIAKAILAAHRTLGFRPLYCEVSQGEWDAVTCEHVGGPWFGHFTICGVPLRVRSGEA